MRHAVSAPCEDGKLDRTPLLTLHHLPHATHPMCHHPQLQHRVQPLPVRPCTHMCAVHVHARTHASMYAHASMHALWRHLTAAAPSTSARHESGLSPQRPLRAVPHAAGAHLGALGDCLARGRGLGRGAAPGLSEMLFRA
jgi:hypothetical protein